jgi:predicted acetyltransferase
MKSETLLPPGVEVRRAAAEEQAIMSNLLQLYAHDFSEFIDLQLQADGRFMDPDLSGYWREEDRLPFLVRVDGHLAGCVLVSRGSRITADPRVWDMAEFFIVRRYRKRGIGAAVAHEIWRRLPGPWEVRILEINHPARAFWRAAIRAFAPSMAEGRMMEVQRNRWEVFSFVSPHAPAAE